MPSLSHLCQAASHPTLKLPRHAGRKKGALSSEGVSFFPAGVRSPHMLNVSVFTPYKVSI
jgi:hypothetical protein